MAEARGRKVRPPGTRTGRFVPCAGNFLPKPLHNMPVFLELVTTKHKSGNLIGYCGVCGHSGFWRADAEQSAFTRQGAIDSVPRGPGMFPAVDGQGRPLVGG